MTTAVPAIVYTTALFSDAHVLSRSHSDDDGDPEGDAALIDIVSPGMVRETQGRIEADRQERQGTKRDAMRKDEEMLLGVVARESRSIRFLPSYPSWSSQSECGHPTAPQTKIEELLRHTMMITTS
jgi:hypothetical protein